MRSIVVLCAILLSGATLSAQEWNTAQKEVWGNVEKYWALDAAGKTEEMLSYFHEDYVGWSVRWRVPQSKASTAKWLSYDHKSQKTVLLDVTPLTIKIYGNVAFVHYLYSQVLVDKEGKEKSVVGRWTGILTKQGDEWRVESGEWRVEKKEKAPCSF